MKEYRLHWQTIVGAVLLSLLWITILFPGMSVSADRYIDAAVSANRYALERDRDITGAEEIVEDYKTGGPGRAAMEKSFNQKIRVKTWGDTSVSRLFLARWALTVKENLDFDGIQLRDGEDLKRTGVRGVLRLWGWLICIPFLAVMFTLVFMLVKGRTFSGVLLVDGILSILCECLGHFLIPSMLWEEGHSAVLSFELVGEEALDQYGTGEHFIKELFSACQGPGWMIVIILSVLIVLYSIVCLMMLVRHKGADDRTGGYVFQNPEVWDKTKSMERRAALRENGILRGIKGEYMGESICIRAGEEIVLGRDPRYCMLIFHNPRVSRRQCGIRYDGVNGCYQAVDYSAGG